MSEHDGPDDLLRLMLSMSGADISVLDAGRKTPDSNLATRPGSANDRLWSRMEARGWMTGRTEEVASPLGRNVVMRIYAISDAGQKPIASLIDAYLRHIG